MSAEPSFVTQEGYDQLTKELDYLRSTRRREVAERLHQALSDGNILENAELEDARNEQAFVEGRILAVGQILSTAMIIEPSETPGDTVGLGRKVTVVEGNGPEETYVIAGPAEANPTNGHISNESPLGRALLGKKVGDIAAVHAPAGVLAFTIVKIE